MRRRYERVLSDSSDAQEVMRKNKESRRVARDLVADVVLQAANSFGVLSSQYRLKIISVDALGYSCIVLMSASSPFILLAPENMNAFEGIVSKMAMLRYGIDVLGVYWSMPRYAQPA